MKRISYLTLAAVMALGLFASLAVAQALPGITCPGYTPLPNSVVDVPYVYKDCPGSDYLFTNNYPALVKIHDGDVGCFGWTNLHDWFLSENGVDKAAFENCSHYRFSAVVNLSSPTGEAGLRVATWWDPNVEGRFMINGGGEIACFGGRLPFYSFTTAYGVRYVPGTGIWMQITYDPNSLTEADPATIQYQLFYNGVGYSSPALGFNAANEAEGHGNWGELTPAYVGGYVQAPNFANSAGWAHDVTWENIQFEGPSATPAKSSTWGQLKTLYK